MSRRSFLHRAGGFVLGLLRWGKSSARARDGAVTLTILHTNDIHGHLTAWTGWDADLKGKTVGGFGRLAGAVAQTRKDAANVLLLDAGDLLGDSMIADLTEGRAMVEALNHLGYDAMSIGNHEPDFGTGVLRQRMTDARFTVIAANLVERKGSKPFAKPYIVKKVGGVSVGVLGLAYPKTPWTTAAKNVAEVEFQPPTPAVRHYLPKMREDGAELVVVLSHLGLSGDQALAKAVEGIDVIVGGHSHNRMTKAETVGTTLIVQAGAHGSDLGRLELTV
ncbi:MAG: metallophosphatase, partial [Planctomycetes bacterium]|nr:metallophosphatase [Planctomycetota bacterium]